MEGMFKEIVCHDSLPTINKKLNLHKIIDPVWHRQLILDPFFLHRKMGNNPVLKDKVLKTAGFPIRCLYDYVIDGTLGLRLPTVQVLLCTCTVS